mmetsp:Transcript_15691/g.27119  ORF Transcript_15691/g.27119 Transcript_15691/m.27119 type:complete len:87 (+) Transcript_15691:520-780(+)
MSWSACMYLLYLSRCVTVCTDPLCLTPQGSPARSQHTALTDLFDLVPASPAVHGAAPGHTTCHSCRGQAALQELQALGVPLRTTMH